MDLSPARGRLFHPSSSPAEAGEHAKGGDRVLWGPSREVLLARLPQLKQPSALPQPVAVVKRSSGTAGLGSPTRQQQQTAEAIKAAAAARLAKRQRRGRQSSSTGCLVFGSSSNNGQNNARETPSTSSNGRSQSADIDRDALLAILEMRLNNREIAVAAAAQEQQAAKRRSLPDSKTGLASRPTVSMVMEETESQAAAAAVSLTDAQMSQGVAQISLKTLEDANYAHPDGSQKSSFRLALAAKNENALPNGGFGRDGTSKVAAGEKDRVAHA